MEFSCLNRFLTSLGMTRGKGFLVVFYTEKSVIVKAFAGGFGEIGAAGLKMLEIDLIRGFNWGETAVTGWHVFSPKAKGMVLRGSPIALPFGQKRCHPY